MTCPSCRKPEHFYISTVTGKSFCQKCRIKNGSWKRTLELLKEQEDTTTFLHSVTPALPSFVQYPQEITRDLPPVAVEYLKSRNIPLKVMSEYRIVYCPYGKYAKRLIVPVIKDNQLEYFVARTLDPKEKLRYLYPEAKKAHLLFNYERAKTSASCVLVEGVFDILPHEMLRNSAVALLGSYMSKEQEYLLISTFKRICVWLDTDKKKEAWEIGERLNKAGCIVTIVEQKRGNDPGECTDILQELAHAVPVRVDSFITQLINRR